MKKCSNTLRKAFFLLHSSQLAACSSNVSRSRAAKSRGLGDYATGTSPPKQFCEGIPWLKHDFLEFSKSSDFIRIHSNRFLIPWFQGLLKDWRQPSITPSCYAAYAPKTETQIPERKWHLTNLVERFERLCPNLDGRIFVGPSVLKLPGDSVYRGCVVDGWRN